MERGKKEEKLLSGYFQQLGLNSVGTSSSAYEIPSEVSEAGAFSHGLLSSWAKDGPWAITPLASGVCSYDVVKGPRRENQKAHGVH